MRSISQLDEVEEMARTISATEAKAKLSSLINWAIKNRDEVVVESRGTPKAAILPYEAYEQYKELREQARRRQLLAQLEELAAQVQTRKKERSGISGISIYACPFGCQHLHQLPLESGEAGSATKHRPCGDLWRLHAAFA
jgi:prevent-host-death family protein